MPETLRNVLIILALAALVMLVPGGGNASAGILQTLVIAMLAAIGWFGVRLYREHRAATDRLWETGPGTVVWVALVALACYGVYFVFRSSREY